MKKTIQNIAKLGLASLMLMAVSCRKDDKPVDVHEHEEANKVVIAYKEANQPNSTAKTVTYNVGAGITEKMDLENNKSYNVTVSFFHDDENITGEIKEEVNEHFMQYLFANLNVNVLRSPSASETRADGKKLGLNTVWAVTSAPVADSKVKVSLIHGPQSVDDVANNGGGSYQGGEPDVAFTVEVE